MEWGDELKRGHIRSWISTLIFVIIGPSGIMVGIAVMTLIIEALPSVLGVLLGVVCGLLLMAGGVYFLLAARMMVVKRTDRGIAIGEMNLRFQQVASEEVRCVTMTSHVNGSGFESICPLLIRCDEEEPVEVTVAAGYAPFGIGRARWVARAQKLADWLDVPFTDTPVDAQ